MRRLQQWLGGSIKTLPAKSGTRRRKQLGMEGLEARELMTIDIAANASFGSYVQAQTATTPAMQSPPIELIFKGTYFGTAAGQAAAQQMITATQNLATGPYLSGLTEYGSDGKATLGSTYINATAFGANFTPTNLNTEVLNDILSTSTPIPRPTTPAHAPIYVVVTDPTETSNSPTFNGYNVLGGFKYNGTTYPTHLVWASTAFNNASDPTKGLNLDAFTVVLSHEIVETMTDPDGNGVVMQRPANLPAAIDPGSATGQICDFETDGGRYQYRVNGVEVQSYWSVAKNEFEIPDGNSQSILLTPNWTTGATPKSNGTYALSYSGASSTITPDNGSGLTLQLGGETFHFAPNVITSVDVKGTSGSTLTIDDSADAGKSPTYTLNGTGTQDTLALPDGISVTAASTVGAIHLLTSKSVTSQVTVNGSDAATTVAVYAGAAGGNVGVNFHERSVNGSRISYTSLGDKVSVYGNANTTLDIYDWVSNSLTYTVAYDTIRQATGPTVDFHGLSNANLHGNGGAVDFEFTAGGTVPTTVVGSGGSTTVHLASSFLGGATAPAPVSFRGGTGYDLLWVDDGSYSTPLSNSLPFNIYEMSDHSVSVRNFTTYFDGSVDHVRLGTSDRINSLVDVYGLTNLTTAEVDTGRATTRVAALFNANAQEALFNNLTLVCGDGSGSSSLVVDDNATSGGTYLVTSNTISDIYRGTIAYSGFGTVQLDGSSDVNTFNIQSTAPNVSTVVAGTGNDFFNVGDANGTLNEIAGPLKLHGALPLAATSQTILTLNDTQVQVGNYTMTSGEYTRAGIAPITWDKMGSVVVNSAPLPTPPASSTTGQGIGSEFNDPILNTGDPVQSGDPSTLNSLVNEPIATLPSSSTNVGTGILAGSKVSSSPASLATASVPTKSLQASTAALHDAALLDL